MITFTREQKAKLPYIGRLTKQSLAEVKPGEYFTYKTACGDGTPVYKVGVKLTQRMMIPVYDEGVSSNRWQGESERE